MAGSDNQGEQLDRRRFVQATGMVAGGLVASGGGATVRSPDERAALTRQASAPKTAGLALGPGRLAIGGRRVVGAEGYETIQAAWDDATSGDVVYVHPSYDARDAGEQFPIVLDYGAKEVALAGGHPWGSVVDAGGTDADVIEVRGGPAGGGTNAAVRNLAVTGGGVGLRIRGAPYGTFAGVVVYDTGSHGVEIGGDAAPDDGQSSAGTTFRDVVAWGCGGDGFRLDAPAHPHGTTLSGCHALFNRGAGVRLRGYGSGLYGGTVRSNGGAGLEARRGCGQLLSGVAFEGNGTRETDPTAVTVGRSAPGLTVDTCYFAGEYSEGTRNGRDAAATAVAVDGAPGTDVRNCTYRRYTDAFLVVREAADVDVHRSSHVALDGTRFVRTDGAERVRSDGVVQETDLRRVPGRYRGDMGIHDGSGGPWGPAVWDGTGWTSVMDGRGLG